MKKIIYLIICFIFFSPMAKAFLGEDLGINLYKNINDGVNELELKQYEFELKGQGESIKDNFNDILKANGYGECLEKELTSKEINEISSGKLEVLYKKIGGDCLSDNGDISNEKFLNIQKTINNINRITKLRAAEKTEKLNNISMIGIYSDGNNENSPFDLITDLQNIDYYIFTEEIPYNGEVLGNNDEIMSDIIDDLSHPEELLDSNQVNPFDLSSEDLLDPLDLFDDDNENENENNQNQELESSYKCIDDVKNSELSGLDEEEIAKLISNSEYQAIDPNGANNQNTNNSNNNASTSDDNETGSENSMGDYQKLNDNSVFPCSSFFCITIDFITYQHNLLGGGDSFSIEYLVNRSNKHLKKFASSSLIQAEMTSNNWEFGLKDLNLPDIFHVGFIISKKPIPILDIESDQNKEDKTRYTKENLLEEYYKNYGLEYSRKNDMKIFEGEYDELKTILDMAELPIGQTSEKISELNNINEKKKKQNDFVSKDVFQTIGNNELENFEKSFVELRKFSKTIKEYIDTIDGIVRFINKIPIDKG